MALIANVGGIMPSIKDFIDAGRACLGIEFGSTRIKAVLIDDKFNIIASGDHAWESTLKDGL